MDIDKKPKSRAFLFFDKLFRMFICNLLCIASMAVPVSIFIFVSIAIGGDSIVFTITDKEKVEYALEEVNVPSHASVDFILTSPEGYTWEILEGDAIKFGDTIENNKKAIVTRKDADQTVVLKLTVKINAQTMSKKFEVKVPKKNTDVISIAEANIIATTVGSTPSLDSYLIEGYIKKIVSPEAGVLLLSDGSNEILIESLSDFKAALYHEMKNKPGVGDYITVRGLLYNKDGATLANATLIEHFDLYEPITPNEEKINSVMLLFAIGVGIFLLTFPFLILPSIVATTKVIKDPTSGVNAFKLWMMAFKDHYKKSMLVGIVYTILLGIIFFSLVFYSILPIIDDIQIIDHLGITDSGILFVFTMKAQEILLSAGYVVFAIFALAGVCFVVHAPMVIITLPKLSVTDLLKTNVFMTINYFVNTIILVAILLVSVIGFFFFPIWLIFGISLPILIGVRFSKVNYHELEKVDFDKINKQIDIDIELEEEE